MPDEFALPIIYNQDQLEFPCTIIRLPYTYQLQIEVGRQKLFFEPDDRGEFRVVKMPWQDENGIRQIDPRLVQVIITELNKLWH
jgi:hypothetical protein